MPYEMKFSINLYNPMRSTRIIVNNRISSADNLGQSTKKSAKKVNFSPDFDLHYLSD